MDDFRSNIGRSFQQAIHEGGGPIPAMVWAFVIVVTLVAGMASPAGGLAVLVLGLLLALIIDFLIQHQPPQASGESRSTEPS